MFLPFSSLTLLILFIIILLALSLEGISFCLDSVVSSFTTLRYSLPFLLFTSSVILFPFESNFALTTFTSTISKLSFSLTASAIIESAIFLTSLALASVVFICPYIIKSVVKVFNIDILISVVLPNFLLANLVQPPCLFNF